MSRDTAEIEHCCMENRSCNICVSKIDGGSTEIEATETQQLQDIKDDVIKQLDAANSFSYEEQRRSIIQEIIRQGYTPGSCALWDYPSDESAQQIEELIKEKASTPGISVNMLGIYMLGISAADNAVWNALEAQWAHQYHNDDLLTQLILRTRVSLICQGDEASLLQIKDLPTLDVVAVFNDLNIDDLVQEYLNLKIWNHEDILERGFKSYWCYDCELWLNGQTQWEDHCRRDRHRANMKTRRKNRANSFLRCWAAA